MVHAIRELVFGSGEFCRVGAARASDQCSERKRRLLVMLMYGLNSSSFYKCWLFHNSFGISTPPQGCWRRDVQALMYGPNPSSLYKSWSFHNYADDIFIIWICFPKQNRSPAIFQGMFFVPVVYRNRFVNAEPNTYQSKKLSSGQVDLICDESCNTKCI